MNEKDEGVPCPREGSLWGPSPKPGRQNMNRDVLEAKPGDAKALRGSALPAPAPTTAWRCLVCQAGCRMEAGGVSAGLEDSGLGGSERRSPWLPSCTAFC